MAKIILLGYVVNDQKVMYLQTLIFYATKLDITGGAAERDPRLTNNAAKILFQLQAVLDKFADFLWHFHY